MTTAPHHPGPATPPPPPPPPSTEPRTQPGPVQHGPTQPLPPQQPPNAPLGQPFAVPYAAARPDATHGAIPPGPPQGPVTDPAGAPARRPGWLRTVGVAAVTAVVASLATVGATQTLDDRRTTPASIASLDTKPSQDVPVAGSSAQDPDWTAVASAVRASVVAIDVETASGAGKGSGVIIDAQGRILTNNHVVGDAVDGGLQVTLADGRVYDARMVGTDPTTDLAVIALTDPPRDLQAAVLGDSDAVEVGEPVMAVGNPLGLDSTVTTGIVSAVDRPVSTSDGSTAVVTNAIQVDAAVNPGNSGGPLFDASGEVIGITSSIASLSGGGGQAGSIGLGFAIPAKLADRIGAELIADGAAAHAFLGVSLTDGTATADATTRRGAVVQEVTDGSPAQKAGLRAGDVVVAVGDQPVNGAESLTAFVRELNAGDDVTLTVVRDGSAVDVDITLAAREDTPQQG